MDIDIFDLRISYLIYKKRDDNKAVEDITNLYQRFKSIYNEPTVLAYLYIQCDQYGLFRNVKYYIDDLENEEVEEQFNVIWGGVNYDGFKLEKHYDIICAIMFKILIEYFEEL